MLEQKIKITIGIEDEKIVGSTPIKILVENISHEILNLECSPSMVISGGLIGSALVNLLHHNATGLLPGETIRFSLAPGQSIFSTINLDRLSFFDDTNMSGTITSDWFKFVAGISPINHDVELKLESEFIQQSGSNEIIESNTLRSKINIPTYIEHKDLLANVKDVSYSLVPILSQIQSIEDRLDDIDSRLNPAP